MVTHAMVSDLVASGDTTPTAGPTLTIAAGTARKITGIWAYAAAAGAMTTTEAISGYIAFDTTSEVKIKPLELPFAVISALTSGSIAYEPRIIPIDIDVPGGCVITSTVTMDMAQTGGIKTRFGILLE